MRCARCTGSGETLTFAHCTRIIAGTRTGNCSPVPVPMPALGADSPRAHVNNAKMDESATKSRSGAREEAAGGRAIGEYADEDEEEDEVYLAFEELLECELCGAQLDSKSELAIHRRLRHGLCAASNGTHASNAAAPGAASAAAAGTNGARASLPSGQFQRL